VPLGPADSDRSWTFVNASLEKGSPEVTIAAKLDGLAQLLATEQLIRKVSSVGTVSGNVHASSRGDTVDERSSLAARAGSKRLQHHSRSSHTSGTMDGPNIDEVCKFELVDTNLTLSPMRKPNAIAPKAEGRTAGTEAAVCESIRLGRSYA